MEYTVENLSKGRKKEDLIKLILDMQADMRKSKNEWEKSVDALAAKNKELSDRLNGRTDEYDRWKTILQKMSQIRLLKVLNLTVMTGVIITLMVLMLF